MRRGDVDDVDVFVFDELFVGSVGGCGGGTFACFEELLCSRGRRGRGGCRDGMLYIGDIPG